MLGAVVALVGCGSSSASWDDQRSQAWSTYGWSGGGTYYVREQPSPPVRPDLPDDAAIDEGLATADATRREGACAVACALTDSRVERWPVSDAARAVRSCFRMGARD